MLSNSTSYFSFSFFSTFTLSEAYLSFMSIALRKSLKMRFVSVS